MPMATKLGMVATYHKILPTIKLHDLFTWYHLASKVLHLHCRNADSYQTCNTVL